MNRRRTVAPDDIGANVIEYGDNFSHMSSIFAAKVSNDTKLRASAKLVGNAMLTCDLIIDIAADLKKIAESERRSRSDALQIKPQPERRVTTRRYRSPNRGRPKEGKSQ